MSRVLSHHCIIKWILGLPILVVRHTRPLIYTFILGADNLIFKHRNEDKDKYNKLINSTSTARATKQKHPNNICQQYARSRQSTYKCIFGIWGSHVWRKVTQEEGANRSAGKDKIEIIHIQWSIILLTCPNEFPQDNRSKIYI